MQPAHIDIIPFDSQTHSVGFIRLYSSFISKFIAHAREMYLKNKITETISSSLCWVYYRLRQSYNSCNETATITASCVRSSLWPLSPVLRALLDRLHNTQRDTKQKKDRESVFPVVFFYYKKTTLPAPAANYTPGLRKRCFYSWMRHPQQATTFNFKSDLKNVEETLQIRIAWKKNTKCILYKEEF